MFFLVFLLSLPVFASESVENYDEFLYRLSQGEDVVFSGSVPVDEPAVVDEPVVVAELAVVDEPVVVAEPVVVDYTELLSQCLLWLKVLAVFLGFIFVHGLVTKR